MRGSSARKTTSARKSPGPDGKTCTVETNSYCYEDCGGNVTGNSSTGCTDNCWWTTCQDSVAQTIAVLDRVEALFCIDTTRVWATGCSNGGMFTFELARDPRMEGRLRGIAPTVGLPHNGFNVGPQLKSSVGSPLSMFGMWGKGDTVVPPLSNMNDSTKSQQTNEEFDDDTYEGVEENYYTTSRNVTELWARINGCTGGRVNLTGQSGKAWDAISNPYGIPSFADVLECTEVLDCDGSAALVECLFDAGHECNFDYMDGPILTFILNQSDMPDLRPPPASPGGPSGSWVTGYEYVVLVFAAAAFAVGVVVKRRQRAQRALLVLDDGLDDDAFSSATSATTTGGCASLNAAAYKAQIDEKAGNTITDRLLGSVQNQAHDGNGVGSASPSPWLDGVQ